MISFTVFPTADDPSKCSQGTIARLTTFGSLRDLVTKQAWAAGQFKGDYRNNDNFLGCDFIALDVDGGCTLSEAMEKHFKDMQYLIYKSRNHLKDKGDGKITDRFRVILPLDRPILSSQEYKATWNSLYQLYPFIDKAAKDPARFFFPGEFQSLREEGKVVNVITSLSARTGRFLAQGAEPSQWNPELFIAAKDMQEQLYTQEQAEELLTRPTLLPGNLGQLDKQDLTTINSAYSKPPMNPPRQSQSFMQITKEGTKPKLNIDQLCRDLISTNFLLQVNNDATFIYTIEDHAKREVALCKNSDVLIRHVSKEITPLVKSGAISLANGKFPLKPEDFVSHWKKNSPALKEPPASFGWPDQADWVIKRLDFLPVKGPHKAWDEFLSRTSDAGALMAFIWSCFELKNRSRQALWLYGPEGQDGKSTILNVLANCFGQAAAGLNNTQIRSDSRFVLANFYNKRLIIYPDAKNTKFPMTEVFRSLTSGDIVPIEFKGEGTVNVRLYVKLLIASNNEPEVTLGKADLSRLIRIDVSPSDNKDDPLWEDRLIKELPEFLYDCKEVYEKLCTNNGQIKLSDRTIALVSDSAHEMHENLQEIFDKYFIADKACEITSGELRNALDPEDFREDQLKNFKRFLLDRYKIKRERPRREDGTRPNIYMGMSLKKKASLNKPKEVK